MSKKGLSADEKAAKLLGWFHETREFWSLKEIEKVAVKATGISGMMIKDVLQTLLDDSLVNMEKVGTSNFYWSYPGASATKLQADYDAAKESLKSAEKKLADAEKTYLTLQKARGVGEGQDQTERQELLKAYYAHQENLEAVKAELSQFASGDPAVYEQKQKDTNEMKDSALRWTDQISSLMCYMRDNGNGDMGEMREMLELPEDYEELSFT